MDMITAHSVYPSYEAACVVRDAVQAADNENWLYIIRRLSHGRYVIEAYDESQDFLGCL